MHERHDGVAVSDACTASEYGDPFSVMGSSNIHVDNNIHRAELGWMSRQTITANGTYQLAPANGPAGGAPRLLQISRPNGTYLELELRKITPIFDNYATTAPVVNGVSLRLGPSPTTTSIVQSKLLDATPETAGFTDAALAVGQTFYDQYGSNPSKVKVTTTAVSTTGATVSIQFTGATPTTTTSPSTTTTKHEAAFDHHHDEAAGHNDHPTDHHRAADHDRAAASAAWSDHDRPRGVRQDGGDRVEVAVGQRVDRGAGAGR